MFFNSPEPRHEIAADYGPPRNMPGIPATRLTQLRVEAARVFLGRQFTIVQETGLADALDFRSEGETDRIRVYFQPGTPLCVRRELRAGTVEPEYEEP